MAAPALLDAEPAMVRAFLGAAARGFEFAAAHPDEAASLLLAGAQAENGVALDAALVRASQAELAGASSLDAAHELSIDNLHMTVTSYRGHRAERRQSTPRPTLNPPLFFDLHLTSLYLREW